MAVLERTLEMDGPFLSLPLQENVATPMTQILHKMVGFQASPRGLWHIRATIWTGHFFVWASIQVPKRCRAAISRGPPWQNWILGPSWVTTKVGLGTWHNLGISCQSSQPDCNDVILQSSHCFYRPMMPIRAADNATQVPFSNDFLIFSHSFPSFCHIFRPFSHIFPAVGSDFSMWFSTIGTGAT